MLELNLEKEWKILNHEMAENKPAIEGSYPDHVVRNRELLLLAQCLLSDYDWSDIEEQKTSLAKVYKLTMELYFDNLRSHN